MPALGALVAEPLFVLTDTAMVGHLGAPSLAGLSVASTVLQTAVGLLVFLAYATTPTVARRLGAGDTRGAVSAGIDGLWLAAALGAALLVAGQATAQPLVRAFGLEGAALQAGLDYLTISLWGLPGMLLVIAATGLLRGLHDTRTPLVVAAVGFAVNAGLNAALIYGAGWGVAGSAAGTAIVQWAMAGVYVVIAVRAARQHGAPLRPGLDGVSGAALAGGWLLLRTASLRAAMLATVAAGSSLGVSSLAALQIALTIFSTLAFVLDALAIAGQAMIGRDLGAGDREAVRAVTRRLLTFGVRGGVLLGIVVAAVSPWLPLAFTSDETVRGMLVPVLLVTAVGVPLAGYVFVLDGVLIGAGDARYLAWTGLLNLLVYLPLLAAAVLGAGDTAGLVPLWCAFALGYVGARAVTLGLRARGERWIVLGSA